MFIEVKFPDYLLPPQFSPFVYLIINRSLNI